jgi:hypothetical protein
MNIQQVFQLKRKSSVKKDRRRQAEILATIFQRFFSAEMKKLQAEKNLPSFKGSLLSVL